MNGNPLWFILLKIYAISAGRGRLWRPGSVSTLLSISGTKTGTGISVPGSEVGSVSLSPSERDLANFRWFDIMWVVKNVAWTVTVSELNEAVVMKNNDHTVVSQVHVYLDLLWKVELGYVIKSWTGWMFINPIGASKWQRKDVTLSEPISSRKSKTRSGHLHAADTMLLTTQQKKHVESKLLTWHAIKIGTPSKLVTPKSLAARVLDLAHQIFWQPKSLALTAWFLNFNLEPRPKLQIETGSVSCGGRSGNGYSRCMVGKVFSSIWNLRRRSPISSPTAPNADLEPRGWGRSPIRANWDLEPQRGSPIGNQASSTSAHAVKLKQSNCCFFYIWYLGVFLSWLCL